MKSPMLRSIVAGAWVYVVAVVGGQYTIQAVQRHLDVIGCQQSAQADHRDDAECKALASKSLVFVTQ